MCLIVDLSNKNTLLNIYSAFVLPLYKYASITYISASNNSFRKIQTIQNAALKSILQLPCYISSQLAHDAALFLFIKEHHMLCQTTSNFN
jgi:hypothetical protein